VSYGVEELIDKFLWSMTKTVSMEMRNTGVEENL
jgi:hypothetical protein